MLSPLEYAQCQNEHHAFIFVPQNFKNSFQICKLVRRITALYQARNLHNYEQNTECKDILKLLVANKNKLKTLGMQTVSIWWFNVFLNVDHQTILKTVSQGWTYSIFFCYYFLIKLVVLTQRATKNKKYEFSQLLACCHELLIWDCSSFLFLGKHAITADFTMTAILYSQADCET